MTPDEIADAIEVMYEAGWTDGLPVVPPTRERVDRFLDYIGRPPHELIAEVPPLGGRATVEKIAINAVMAGCRPEYLPVVIAALEAMMEDKFNLRGVQCSTHISTPLLIVNGPIVKQLNINYGSNVFGQGWRANATIGRAVKLILVNLGGAIPGDTDKATFGHPGKYTYCIAENEDANPWEPFHVERGYAATDSTVTVFGAEAPHNLNNHGADNPRDLLLTLADSMATLGNNQMYVMGESFVVLGPEHARIIAQAGWSKGDVKRFLFEHARQPVGKLRLGGIYGRDAHKNYLWPRWIDRDNDRALVPVARRPEDIRVIVAGGPGRHSVYLPGWGSRSATRKIAIEGGPR